MKVVLIREREITMTVLPPKVGGQHFVKYRDSRGNMTNLIAISASGNEWVCKSNKYIDFISDCDEDENGKKEIFLKENEYHKLLLKATGEKMIMLTEPIDKTRSTFSFYNVSAPCEITVGYHPSCEIRFCDDGLSETVGARIAYGEDGKITVSDMQSINGTYLNGERISSHSANYGDELYMVGLRIILGKDFIAVNNPSGSVSVSLPVKETLPVSEAEEEDEEEIPSDTFSSAPRKIREVRCRKISLDPPPSQSEDQGLPWLVMIGPSLTMAVASVFSSVFTIQNIIRNNGEISSVLPTLVMSVCMVLGTIIWPIFTKRFEKRARNTKHALAVKEYLRYLAEVEAEIDSEIKLQEEIKRSNNPTLEDCIKRINNREMTLWERSTRHKDFLDVPIGCGDIAPEIELSYPARSVNGKLSEAGLEMYRLAERELLLKNVPITLPIAKTRIIGFTGIRETVVAAIKALLLQVTALHNYDDLKIIFICDEKEAGLWKCVKWLPHLWNNEKTLRYIANDAEEAKELSSVISNIQAIHASNTNGETDEPHYLIIATDRILAEKIQALKDFCRNPEKYDNITLLTLYDEQRFLPKTCSIVCNYEEQTTVSDFNNITGEVQVINSPALYSGDPEPVFINMANTVLDTSAGEKRLPTELTYLEMFEAGKPEHLDIIARWEESDSVNTLAAPIGIDADGFEIKLDIHEKAHGPHGLIAGMTGSGKSEFIISYIASMAVSYSPEEVSFVLIDFKGGGMADVFRSLPHLAGSITNLDGNELQRSFFAIESELEKRQALFKEISEKKKISNIDIYKYQKLRKADRSLKALPHLIIISDEFAELKQQHNDFMQQLIRIARIGRSLGVHLILATQKPDGVVDDQIRSNIKFKVCLKVQDRADSQSVIGRPDATLITNAGRFYLQVGYNELFEYGQSPWSGAPYFPEEQFRQSKKNHIDVLNEQGKVIWRVAPPQPPRDKNIPEKQIDALVGYISSISKEKGYAASSLWLPPLKGPEKERKAEKAGSDASPFVLNPVIGLYDDIKNQKHCVLTVPFTENGHTVIYGSSGSGKLSFLNKMLVSLMERHSPSELTVYAFDCDAGSLSAFEDAPHMRTVALSGETEKFEAALTEISEALAERKNLFKRFGGEFGNYIAQSGKTLPNILLIVHNFSAFTEDFSAGEEYISKIAREGKKYGIFVTLTGTDSNAVRYRLVPMFSNVYALRMSNDDQYRDILGRTELIPSEFKGRGIFRDEGETYEFQVDMVFREKNNTFDAIKEFCAGLIGMNEQNEEKLRTMPQRVDRKYFEENGITVSAEKLPIALAGKSITPIYANLISSKLFFIAYEESDREISGILDMISSLSEERICLDSENASEKITEIWNLAKTRSDEIGEHSQAGNQLPDFEHLIVIINRYSDLTETLDENAKAMLNGMILGITDKYHIHFIITDRGDNYHNISGHNMLGHVMPFTSGIALGNDIRLPGYFGMEKLSEEQCDEGYGYLISNCNVRYGKVVSELEG